LLAVLIIGCSIGTVQSGQVIVDDSLSTAYEAQPGRQEWVTHQEISDLPFHTF
jgi:hypothetical protein